VLGDAAQFPLRSTPNKERRFSLQAEANTEKKNLMGLLTGHLAAFCRSVQTQKFSRGKQLRVYATFSF
jgi:hypothetical protein